MDNECSIISFDLEYAIKHGIVVSKTASILARELKLSENAIEELAIAGLLHDIGKLKLSRYLYGRKDIMQIEELRYVRQHPYLSREICQKYDYSEFVEESVYYHHENFDGSGYPENLVGYNIPLGARILRVCDVFAALISDRPYRTRFEPDVAMELMIDEVKNFDMRVFIVFQRAYNMGLFDFLFNEPEIEPEIEELIINLISDKK